MILRKMLDLCKLFIGFVIDLFRPRAAVEAEILVLRQQIIVLRRGGPGRVPLLAVDRMVLGWVCLPALFGLCTHAHGHYARRTHALGHYAHAHLLGDREALVVAVGPPRG
jgi:hypothetical protein